GGDAEIAQLAEPLPVDVPRAPYQRRARASGALGDFLQALRVRGIGRADHDHGFDLRRDALDGFLAVGGGIADVVLLRTHDSSEALLEERDGLRGIVPRAR